MATIIPLPDLIHKRCEKLLAVVLSGSNENHCNSLRHCKHQHSDTNQWHNIPTASHFKKKQNGTSDSLSEHSVGRSKKSFVVATSRALACFVAFMWHSCGICNICAGCKVNLLVLRSALCDVCL